MLRTLLVLLPLLAAACGSDDTLQVLQTGALPAGTTEIELGEAPLRMATLNYALVIKSSAPGAVRMKVRLEEPAPEGAQATLSGETTILPRGTGRMTLSFVPPRVAGPFESSFTLHTDDVPDWSYTYRIRGVMVDRPPEGRYVEVEPAGIDFGEVEAGQRLPFSFEVKSFGTQAITVSDWRAENAERVRMRAGRAQTLEPGASLKLDGLVLAPQSTGPFREIVRVFSAADNATVRVVVLAGTVVADYASIPHTLRWGNVFAAERPECTIRLQAREGVPAFTVASADGEKPFFDVVSLGGDEPAAEQQVRLRIRRDAPIGPVRDQKVRFRIEPGGQLVDWSVSMNILPAIYADPPRVDFRQVRFNESAAVDVRLLAFANRRFEVKSVQSDNARFIVVKKGGAGIPWTIRVLLAPGIRPGPHTGTIRVTTDDEDVPEIHIPVRVNVVQ